MTGRLTAIKRASRGQRIEHSARELAGLRDAAALHPDEVRRCGTRRRTSNIGTLERYASAVGGGVMLSAGLRRMGTRAPGLGLILSALGGYLVYRGVSGRSWLYKLIGASPGRPPATSHPLSREISVREAVTIQRTGEELYRAWRHLRDLPRFMRRVQEVEVIDDETSRWTVRGPGGRSLRWEAMIVDDIPGERIAWVTLPGSDVEHRGRIAFEPAAGDRGTIMRVELIYRPPAGALGAAIAGLLGRGPAHEVRHDLRRFKQQMEAGELTSNAGPAARRSGNCPPPRSGPYQPRAARRFGPPLGYEPESGTERATYGIAAEPGPAAEEAHEDRTDMVDDDEVYMDVVEQASRESFPGSDAPAWAMARVRPRVEPPEED